MWGLVYITLTATSVESVRIADYDDMYTCFNAREVLIKSVSTTEYFPKGQQAVCIYKGEENEG